MKWHGTFNMRLHSQCAAMNARLTIWLAATKLLRRTAHTTATSVASEGAPGTSGDAVAGSTIVRHARRAGPGGSAETMSAGRGCLTVPPKAQITTMHLANFIGPSHVRVHNVVAITSERETATTSGQVANFLK